MHDPSPDRLLVLRNIDPQAASPYRDRLDAAVVECVRGLLPRGHDPFEDHSRS